MVTVFELKEKIISCAVFHPEPSAHALRRFLASESGRAQFAALCGIIHFDYARRVFDWIPEEEWTELKELGRRQGASPSSLSASFLQEMLTAMIAEQMTWDGDQKPRDPFSFLRSMDDARIRSLFSQEPASRIAMIAAFWDPWDLKRILNLIPASVSKETILHIARMEKLPQDALKNAALNYADKLRQANRKPVVPPPFRHQVEVAALVKPARKPVLPPPLPPIHASRKVKSAITPNAAEKLVMSFLQTEAPDLFRKLTDHRAASRTKNGDTIHLSEYSNDPELAELLELIDDPRIRPAAHFNS